MQKKAHFNLFHLHNRDVTRSGFPFCLHVVNALALTQSIKNTKLSKPSKPTIPDTPAHAPLPVYREEYLHNAAPGDYYNPHMPFVPSRRLYLILH